MTNNTFFKDLAFGEKYQDKLLEYIDYEEAEIIDCNEPFYEWDVKIMNNNVEKTYEVKACRISYYSKHIFIEHMHNNKPSGILKTNADYYAYFVVINENEEELYIIPTNILIEFLKNEKYKSIDCGYKKLSKCMLIPLKHLTHYKTKKLV